MLLSVKNLCTEFPVKKGVVKAVEDVSFEMDEGEILAIVGESGSGKSVTSLSVMGLLAEPGHVAGGSMEFMGRDLVRMSEKEYRELRGNEIAMIFQEPMTSLNPVYRIGNQIVEAIRTHEKIDKKAAMERAVDLLRKVGIPSPEKRVYDYPHQMSGGMRQRVMIAMALACNPKLLIADEPTTALDVTIQAQILDLLRRLRDEEGMSVVLITHDLGVVASLCNRIAVMYGGLAMEYGTTDQIFYSPRHPYTRALLGAIPNPRGRDCGRLVAIPGSAPSLIDPPAGCPFAERCEFACDRCREQIPAWKDYGNGQQARCIFSSDELDAQEQARGEVEGE